MELPVGGGLVILIYCCDDVVAKEGHLCIYLQGVHDFENCFGLFF